MKFINGRVLDEELGSSAASLQLKLFTLLKKLPETCNSPGITIKLFIAI
ncbi:MAG: hypothetical protein HRT88_23040 [Lentisphaeraceae bacterium]|nr:hypothetical protein [Lentisphaeraceae bacterium]